MEPNWQDTYNLYSKEKRTSVHLTGNRQIELPAFECDHCSFPIPTVRAAYKALLAVPGFGVDYKQAHQRIHTPCEFIACANRGRK